MTPFQAGRWAEGQSDRDSARPLSGSPTLHLMDVTWLTLRATQGRSRLCLLHGVNFASQGLHWAACSQSTGPRLCPQDPTGARLVLTLPRDHPDPGHVARSLRSRPWSLSTHGPPFKTIRSIPYLTSGETESHRKWPQRLALNQVSTPSLALERQTEWEPEARMLLSWGGSRRAVAVADLECGSWPRVRSTCECRPSGGWWGRGRVPGKGPGAKPLGMVTALPFRGPRQRCALGAGHQGPCGTMDVPGRSPLGPLEGPASRPSPHTCGQRSDPPVSTTGPDPTPALHLTACLPAPHTPRPTRGSS